MARQKSGREAEDLLGVTMEFLRARAKGHRFAVAR